MLKGQVKPIAAYSEAEIREMYRLMAEFYDHTDEQVFRKDFFDKDYCLALYADSSVPVGFTTQKVLTLQVGGKTVHGVFSGDTIIDRKYWGDIELFRVWANFWFSYAEKYEEFYWFLICKGYKTYRMLPVFWKEFYPNCRFETPAFEKQIIDAYGELLYPDEYNSLTGVVEYRSEKDRLKDGVADIGEKELKNKDIAFFAERNPGYRQGNDIACLAKIDKSVLRSRVSELLSL